MGAAIEAPLAFLQVPVKTLLADPVESAHMAFGLTPEIFNPVDMVASSGDEGLTMIHTPMMKLRDIQCVIRRETVGIHNAVGADLLADDWHQGLGFGIGDEGGKHFASAF